MSTVTSAVTTCPALQDALNNYFVTCSRTRLGSPVLSFLNSPTNRSGIQQIVNPSPNKKRTVQLVYDQPIWTTEVSTVASCDKICTAETERGDLYTEYTIDCTEGLYVENLMKTSDWNESCRNNQEVLIARLDRMVGALADAVAEKTAQELPPLVGSYSADTALSGLTIDVDDFLVVATQIASSTNIDPQAFQQIDLALMQTGYCNGTFIAGGSQLYQYYRLMQAGCCADQGIDALEMLNLYGKAVTWDRWVANEFGDDVSLVFQPGSVQLLTYNDTDPAIQNLGGLADLDMTYRNFFEAIITDPVTGLRMDFTMKNDCGQIHMVLKATTKAVGLPLDIYPSGHPLEGVTYLNGIQVTNS